MWPQKHCSPCSKHQSLISFFFFPQKCPLISFLLLIQHKVKGQRTSYPLPQSALEMKPKLFNWTPLFPAKGDWSRWMQTQASVIPLLLVCSCSDSHPSSLKLSQLLTLSPLAQLLQREPCKRFGLGAVMGTPCVRIILSRRQWRKKR